MKLLLRRSLLGFALLQSCLTHSELAQAIVPVPTPLWTKLTCKAQTTRILNFGETGNSKDSYSMKIIRRDFTLDVTVNGGEYQKAFGDAALATDRYHITGCGIRSISAIHVVARDSVMHTLVISNDGKQGLWTETAYSWTPPFRPVGSMVLLACK